MEKIELNQINLEGWQIGECPEEYRVESYLYDITPIPVISHTWQAAWDNEKIELSVSVVNSGTSTAAGLKVWVAVEAENGLIYTPRESEPFDLLFGVEMTKELIVDFPKKEVSRLCVKILNQDGYYLSQSFSDWLET